MINARNEPVALVGLIEALLLALAALAVGLGWIDDSDAALLMGVAAAVIPLVAFFLVRPRVTPYVDVIEIELGEGGPAT